jgi:hypothetical protein
MGAAGTLSEVGGQMTSLGMSGGGGGDTGVSFGDVYGNQSSPTMQSKQSGQISNSDYTSVSDMSLAGI